MLPQVPLPRCLPEQFLELPDPGISEQYGKCAHNPHSYVLLCIITPQLRPARSDLYHRLLSSSARCAPLGFFLSFYLPYDEVMRLLLVEDDARIARFVAKGLREQAYAVDVATTGDDALYQAAVNTYDLVILDVMIPGKDGFAVCRELRKSGQRMPILMLTARDAVEDRIAGLDHGADDYLTKPFEFRELLARLRALLRRSGELRPPRITIGDLVLDTGAQSATRGGRHVILTAKEYALLEYLARNPGRVVGRAEIAEHVWDETFDPFSNLIEVYINRLRRKIDADSPKPLLQTRRGAGYVLGTAADSNLVEAREESISSRQRAKSAAHSRKSHA
jgi:two-component system copper resistance phosphate regulon response regulator CusR